MNEIHEAGIHVMIDCDSELLELLIRSSVFLAIAEYEQGRAIEFAKDMRQYAINKKAVSL